MPLQVIDEGEDNHVLIDPDVLAQGAGQIRLTGDSNRVEIGAGCSTVQFQLRFGSRCRFVAGAGCRLAALEVFADTAGIVSIGDGSQFTGHTRVYLHEPGCIRIGRGCLVGSDTLLMNSDMHSIIDLASRSRINPARDITIGDAVWLAANVTVLKGGAVGEGSVVGFGSVVTGVLPAECLAAGSPARVLRERIAWRPELV